MSYNAIFSKKRRQIVEEKTRIPSVSLLTISVNYLARAKDQLKFSVHKQGQENYWNSRKFIYSSLGAPEANLNKASVTAVNNQLREGSYSENCSLQVKEIKMQFLQRKWRNSNSPHRDSEATLSLLCNDPYITTTYTDHRESSSRVNYNCNMTPHITAVNLQVGLLRQQQPESDLETKC